MMAVAEDHFPRYLCGSSLLCSKTTSGPNRRRQTGRAQTQAPLPTEAAPPRPQPEMRSAPADANSAGENKAELPASRKWRTARSTSNRPLTPNTGCTDETKRYVIGSLMSFIYSLKQCESLLARGPVRADGMLSMPLIGEVKLMG